jgi:hypothetical protein
MGVTDDALTGNVAQKNTPWALKSEKGRLADKNQKVTDRGFAWKLTVSIPRS